MPRRSKADAAETRQRIIETARALFAEQGYFATTTAQIARTAAVTEGALFNHFPDKKSLFREILAALQADYDKGVRDAAMGDGTGTAMERVQRAFSASVTLARAPAFARIVLQEGRGVLGAADWHVIDSGMGARSAEFGLRAIAGETGAADTDMAVRAQLVLGMLNAAIFVDQDPASPVSAEDCLRVIGEVIAMWFDESYKK